LALNGNGWSPRTITRFIQALGTATETVRVDTDLGEGFLKTLGNREGPHVLACEYVGSRLADWLGLSTLDFALIDLTEADEIPFLRGGKAAPGPAFISRAEPFGAPWGGTDEDLRMISNKNEISGLVVLDTWILNCDRYAPLGRRVNRDNVFLVQRLGRKKEVLLKAMDFTHAFTCGRDIDRRIGFIDKCRDESVYGLFPQFRGFLEREYVRGFVNRLGQFTREVAREFIEAVPEAWEVDRDGRSAWALMLCDRARFVSETIEMRLWPQMEFDEGGAE
jgi:hypothetical protein